jgi:hypothetical protein
MAGTDASILHLRALLGPSSSRARIIPTTCRSGSRHGGASSSSRLHGGLVDQYVEKIWSVPKVSSTVRNAFRRPDFGDPTLIRPPISPAYTLNWAQQLYALRTTRSRDGEFNRIRFATVRQIRSAASWYFTHAMSMQRPGQVMRDRFRRGMVMPVVSPTDEALTTLTASGMARRLGTEVKKSWALSHVHIAYIDAHLNNLYETALDDDSRHELACAGAINLLAYLGWLRSMETFAAASDSVTLVYPLDGPTRGLSPNIGAIELRLLAATKSDQMMTADVIIAWTSLSGLSLDTWMSRLANFDSTLPDRLFSTNKNPVWTSQHFRQNYAYPILELQRASGEPTLKAFSDRPGPATALWTRSIPCIPGGRPAAGESLGRLDITSPILRALVWPHKRKFMSMGDGRFLPPRRTCHVAITNGTSWIVLESHCSVCDILGILIMLRFSAATVCV